MAATTSRGQSWFVRSPKERSCGIVVTLGRTEARPRRNWTYAESFSMLERVRLVTSQLAYSGAPKGEFSSLFFFLSLISAPTAIPQRETESPRDSRPMRPLLPLCEGDGGLRVCLRGFYSVLPCLPCFVRCVFPFFIYVSSFRRVLFIFDVFSSFSTLSLYFRRVRSIFDTCSPFLMRFLHLSRVLLTRPPHDVGWWVHVTPRFGGLPFLFVLTRPPHDVRWWVHATPRFGGLPFVFVLTRPPHDVRWRVHASPHFDGLPSTLYFSPGHLTT